MTTPSSAGSRTSYRADVDGLRAIAVLAVIIFHLGTGWLDGGFVGVDIFFVISGFVITRQIRDTVTTGRFTLKDFYLRRIRRIMPPLLAMLAAVIALAFLILKPEDIHSFAKSALAQSLSLQNFVFLAEGEYFVGAERKPLLHTWSLAVEEQFYLFWPLLLLALRRATPRTTLVVLVATIGASFALNLVLMGLSPKLSFFLLPTRAWELGMGGLAAVLTENRTARPRMPDGVQRAASWLGMAAIAYSVVFISAKDPFPGKVALIPVMGAFLLLLSKPDDKFSATRVLSHPLLVYIGLLSYSLYLWHWPVLVFMSHLGFSTTGFFTIAAALGLTFILAWSSFKFVETPVRLGRRLPTPRALVASVSLGLVSMAFLALHILVTQGAAYRYDAQARPYLVANFDSRSDRCGVVFRVLHPRSEVCELTSRPHAAHKVLLWGNSHADMWSGMLSQLADQHDAALFLNAKNCRATIDSAFCNATVQNRILEFVKDQKISDVILASSWHGAYDIADEIFESQLENIVQRLSVAGVRLWLVIDPPQDPELNPVQRYQQNSARPTSGAIALKDYNVASRDKADALFRRLAAHEPAVQVVDVMDAYCMADACHGGNDQEVWYRDNSHLTNTGARRARDKFVSVFHALAPSQAGDLSSMAPASKP